MNVEPRIYDRALNQISSVHATFNRMELDLHRQKEVWTLSFQCSVKAIRMVGGLSG